MRTAAAVADTRSELLPLRFNETFEPLLGGFGGWAAHADGHSAQALARDEAGPRTPSAGPLVCAKIGAAPGSLFRRALRGRGIRHGKRSHCAPSDGDPLGWSCRSAEGTSSCSFQL